MHSLFPTSHGFVWGFGSNEYDQLSLHSGVQSQTTPILLPLQNILSVSVGYSHSLFLSSDQRVFASGSNANYQLGLTDSELHDRSLLSPTLISSLHNIIAISSGHSNSLFLDSNGHVFSCGENDFGQLGLNNTNDQQIPTMIQELENIIAIAAGLCHSICLDQDGKVWSFGSNEYGRLGLGHDARNRLKPEPILNIPPIHKISLSSSGSHTLLLDFDGYVWVFGSNSDFQLGFDDARYRYTPTKLLNLPRIMEISAGFSHSILLDENHDIWTFGFNNSGQSRTGAQRGFNDLIHRRIPTKIDHQMRIIEEIKAGAFTSFFLNDKGEVWGCGFNGGGRLGLGDITKILVPTKIEGMDDDVHLEKIPERQRIPSALSYI